VAHGAGHAKTLASNDESLVGCGGWIWTSDLWVMRTRRPWPVTLWSRGKSVRRQAVPRFLLVR